VGTEQIVARLGDLRPDPRADSAAATAGIGVDIAEPAEFYGDLSGQTWEHIPVEPQPRPD